MAPHIFILPLLQFDRLLTRLRLSIRSTSSGTIFTSHIDHQVNRSLFNSFSGQVWNGNIFFSSLFHSMSLPHLPRNGVAFTVSRCLVPVLRSLLTGRLSRCLARPATCFAATRSPHRRSHGCRLRRDGDRTPHSRSGRGNHRPLLLLRHGPSNLLIVDVRLGLIRSLVSVMQLIHLPRSLPISSSTTSMSIVITCMGTHLGWHFFRFQAVSL